MHVGGRVGAGRVPGCCDAVWCLVLAENSSAAIAPSADGWKGCEESSAAVWSAAVVLLASTDDGGGAAMESVLYCMGAMNEG
jgi:hypothetical protein